MKRLGQGKYVTLLLSVTFILVLLDPSKAMSDEEKRKAKEQVVEMFYHAYNSYMDYAYPADELMPLSCKGRHRGSEPPRGDIDDSLGNFTLTLIDTLDTLAVLGDVEGFDEAVQNIIRDARYDCDVIVSVFETNIRVLGGLLGGHVMATYFKRHKLGLGWYNDELLTHAKEVGDRLLPAFNTSTGIPYPRVNLKHGVVPQISSSHRDTCTACAGSMILEFAALSRLTGIPVYEDRARKAMDYLWQQRHRGSDLMGLIINVHSGDWIRRESGVGAGIDSYYEYVLKAYVLLGDDDYLARFNKHYDAVMRYVSQGPLLMDVHMHKPNAISRNFMDALLAFWPGLQVLKGDLVPAIETHEMLYQVMQRHNFIPEAFTTDFRVHWSHHPLRPEFIESTYFLYKATGDDYYLEAGKKVLQNLEEHARVPCGYAALKNVKTGAHEDQMDSYVLAEMFKYLYLLFAERSDLLFDIDDFIFTTEAHLLPLALSIGNITVAAAAHLPKIRREVYRKFQVDITPPASDNYITTTITPNLNAKNDADEVRDGEEEEESGADHVCPNLHATHADGLRYPHSVRLNIQNIVNRVSPKSERHQSRLRAADFIAGNKEQLEMLHTMGIRIATMADGRIQLLHTASEALTPEDAEDGMQFMQEMIELSKQQQPEAQHDPMFIHVIVPGQPQFTLTVRAGPAQFGYNLKESSPVLGYLAIARPFRACRELENAHELSGHIVILERGDCMFVDKARNLQRVGAKGGIVLDHTEGSSSDTQPLFAMSGDGVNDVDIPLVFLYHKEGQSVLKLLEDNSFLEVQLASSPEGAIGQQQEKQEAETSNLPHHSGSAGPDFVRAESGQTQEMEPPPLSQRQPADPLMSTGGSLEEEDMVDGFDQAVDDKFYHHEAQLRDLYYLQTGSRYLHINLEVRPSPTRPPPLSQREDAFSLDILPDGSKMLTLRLTYQSPGYEKHKPHLSQLYMDVVNLLQLHSNFNELPHAPDYLRALARLVEAAYFGMDHVDRDALYLVRDLQRKLQYEHRFRNQPEAPPVAWRPSDPDGIESGANSQTKLPPPPVPQEDSLQQDQGSYAQAADFVETPQTTHQDAENAIPSSSEFVRVVPPGDGDAAFGARVNEEGVLNLVGDAHHPPLPPQPRKTISVRVSVDSSREEVVVKISDSESTVSQFSAFSTGEEVRSGDQQMSGSSAGQTMVGTTANIQQAASDSSPLPILSEPVRTKDEGTLVTGDQEFAHHQSGSHHPGDSEHGSGDSPQQVSNIHHPHGTSLPEGPHKVSNVGGQEVVSNAGGQHVCTVRDGPHTSSIGHQGSILQHEASGSIGSDNTQSSPQIQIGAVGEEQRTRSVEDAVKVTGSKDREYRRPDDEL